MKQCYKKLSVDRKVQYDHKHFKLTKNIFWLAGKVPC